MSLEFVENYKAVRARLRNPPNAFKKAEPPAEISAPQVFKVVGAAPEPDVTPRKRQILRRQREKKFKKELDARQKNFQRSRVELTPGISHVIIVASIVCNELMVNRDELYSKRRTAPVYAARELICFISHEHLGKGYKPIGRMLDRDHASVIHAVQNAKRRIAGDPEYAQLIERLWAQVQSVLAGDVDKRHNS